MFSNSWVDKAVLTPSDMQTLSKYYKQAGVCDSIWDSL